MALWSLIASILEPFPGYTIYYVKSHNSQNLRNGTFDHSFKILKTLFITNYLSIGNWSCFHKRVCSQCLKQRWSVQARVYAAHIFQSEDYLLLSLNVIKLQQLEYTISHLMGWMRLTSIKSGEGWTEWLTSAGSAGWGRRVLILTTSFPPEVKYHELQSPLYVIKHLGRLQNFCVLLQLAQLAQYCSIRQLVIDSLEEGQDNDPYVCPHPPGNEYLEHVLSPGAWGFFLICRTKFPTFGAATDQVTTIFFLAVTLSSGWKWCMGKEKDVRLQYLYPNFDIYIIFFFKFEYLLW